MIEVHTKRDMRINLGQRVDQFRQNDIVGIGARPAAGLQDHGRSRLVGGRHNGEALLHIGHVERGHRVVVFSSMIEQLAKGDSSHRGLLVF